MAVLLFGFFISFADLFEPRMPLFANDADRAAIAPKKQLFDIIAWGMIVFLCVSWVTGMTAVLIFSARWSRMACYKHTALHLPIMSAAILVFGAISYALSSGFMAGIGGAVAMGAALTVVAFASGPAAIWLLMQRGVRREAGVLRIRSETLDV
jgi:hypothetical protein